MTKDEVRTMLKYLDSAYRHFYEGVNPTDVLEVWADAFKDEERIVVAKACGNYVKLNPHPPTIAGIMKQVQLIKDAQTDTDYWALIQKAIGNSIYNSKEEFEKLPEVCKSFVGSASALRDMAQADTGVINTVVKGQFLKRVEAIREHQNVQKGLPVSVVMALEESKMLEGETDD